MQIISRGDITFPIRTVQGNVGTGARGSGEAISVEFSVGGTREQTSDLIRQSSGPGRTKGPESRRR